MPETEQDKLKPKPKQEIIDGEIIAEFRDETLMNLPKLPEEEAEQKEKPAPPAPIAPPPVQEPVDTGRRQFFVRLAIGGATALALGGSAALLLQGRREPSVVVLPNGAQVDVDGSLDVAALVQQIADLQQNMAVVTAERDQYKSDLARVVAKLEEAEKLNALYKQLDDIGLDDLLDGALSVVSAALTAVLGVVGLVTTGLADGEKRLNGLATNFPGPQSGIIWLQGQIDKLADSIDQLGKQVQAAVEPVEPYTQMIADFVLWVLERLPFGAGAKAKAGLEGMQAVISFLPDLVSGVKTTVLVPLADWFGKDSKRNLLGILVDPLIDGMLKPAQDMMAKFDIFQTDYADMLATPAQEALTQRAAIREQIRQLQAGQG